VNHLQFIINCLLIACSVSVVRKISTHGAVSLAGHRPDPRQAEIYNSDRVAPDREDHGGRHLAIRTSGLWT